MNDFTRTIEQDRLELLLRFPFFGKCICHCEILPGRQNDVLSCNDCRRIYLAAEIYCNLAQSQRLWLLAHEVCHIVLRHAFRKGERDEERFNFAADAEISFLLNGEDLSPVYTLSVASDWKGLTAEEIYDTLPDNNIPDNIPMHCYPSGTLGVADKVDGKSVENEAGGEYPVGGSYNNGEMILQKTAATMARLPVSSVPKTALEILAVILILRPNYSVVSLPKKQN